MSDDDRLSRKRCGESASQEVASKKAKVDDDSDSYSSLTPSESEPPKKETKKRKTKKKAPSLDESSSSSDDERPALKKPNKDDRVEASPGQTVTTPASGKETSPTLIGTDSGRGFALKS